MGEDAGRMRRALLAALLLLAVVLYYARVAAARGSWYDSEAVIWLCGVLLAAPIPLLIYSELALTRRKLLLALHAPFLVSVLPLEAAALLAGSPSVHDAFGLAVALFTTASALYGLATQLARGEGA
ncbi:MAG: hypothetical protein LM590_14760 [Thermofilum sp.]|jgi:hypothetical protein|nr:hypothetical protein [Thermofilum sp.]